MDLPRSILFAALCVVGLLLWQAWQHDYPTNTPVVASANTTTMQTPTTPIVDAAGLNSNVSAISEKISTAEKRLIQVNTDVLQVSIDTLGGTINEVDLKAYPKSVKDKTPLTLLNDKPGELYLAGSGIVGKGIPTQGMQFSSAQTNYNLAAGQKELQVILTWNGDNGLTVTKTFSFAPNSYLIKVDYQIQNQNPTTWTGNFYAQIIRQKPNSSSHNMFQINPFTGAAVSSPDNHYQKLSFDDLAKQNLNLSTAQGWMTMQQHYFLSAWIPPADQTYHYTSKALGEETYLVQLASPTLNVAPNEKLVTGAKFYVGPAVADTLKQIAPGLDLTVDYGVLWIISSAIFWLMKQIYNIVHNWGWSIVLVTLVIKLLFYHLSAKSYRSMAAMRKLQPRIMQLKERYGDDRQKMSQATLELYKTEKVNPLGGCLPILVQIPVFIALYWVLVESVELRQAPFILWIHDLAIPDPYYVLPVIMGITMFLQQKMSPPPPDPVQAKVFMFLPVVFTVFFLNFPAGLVLYWLVNNTLSIIQQWYITYRYEHAPKKK